MVRKKKEGGGGKERGKGGKGKRGCDFVRSIPTTPQHLPPPHTPTSYPVSLFSDFNAHVLAAHNATSLVSVLKTLPSWNEFTPMGTFLMLTRPEGGRGGWYVKPQAHPHVLQAWSWGGFDARAVARWEGVLRGGKGVK